MSRYSPVFRQASASSTEGVSCSHVIFPPLDHRTLASELLPYIFDYIDRACGGRDNCSMDSQELQPVVDIVLRHFPETEALYLFGSRMHDELRSGSDLDIAVLLSPARSADAEALLAFEVRPELEETVKMPVDCVNLRKVSVVFRKEIIFSGARIFTGDEKAAEEFEMLTMSYYQKLNDERRDILDELFRTKRAYTV